MSYASTADLRSWFVQQRLDSYLPKPETAQEDRLQEALDAASGEMDGYFQTGGYSVPIDTTTAPSAAARVSILKAICLPLALDTLRLSLDGMPENLNSQIEGARRRLRAIRGLQGYRADGSSGRVAAFEDLPGLSRTT